MSTNVRVRDEPRTTQPELCNTHDWEDVIRIYKEGIASVNATFETEVPDWKSWDANHFSACRIVANSGAQIVGWATLCPISKRDVYSAVAKVSIYVATSAQGQGIGKALLRKLVNLSENEGIWTLQAGIFPENDIRISLHKSCGFREVGLREKIGKMKGNWRDVVLMERRSNLIGTLRKGLKRHISQAARDSGG